MANYLTKEKIKLFTKILAVIFIIYSVAWIIISLNIKKLVVAELKSYNKISYDKVSISGFPTHFSAKIVKPELKSGDIIISSDYYIISSNVNFNKFSFISSPAIHISNNSIIKSFSFNENINFTSEPHFIMKFKKSLLIPIIKNEKIDVTIHSKYFDNLLYEDKGFQISDNKKFAESVNGNWFKLVKDDKEGKLFFTSNFAMVIIHHDDHKNNVSFEADMNFVKQGSEEIINISNINFNTDTLKLQLNGHSGYDALKDGEKFKLNLTLTNFFEFAEYLSKYTGRNSDILKSILLDISPNAQKNGSEIKFIVKEVNNKIMLGEADMVNVFTKLFLYFISHSNQATETIQ